jgi:hypothetical protein
MEFYRPACFTVKKNVKHRALGPLEAEGGVAAVTRAWRDPRVA